MKKTIRLTRHYTFTLENGVAVLHHSPVTGLYFANKAKYQRERRRAYRVLADSGRSDIQVVKGYSYVLDYSRDGFSVKTEQPQLVRDTLGLIALWINNVYNWVPWRGWKLIRHLRKRTIKVGTMEWGEFVRVFGSIGERACSFW